MKDDSEWHNGYHVGFSDGYEQAMQEMRDKVITLELEKRDLIRRIVDGE